ncbi:hypothetical protein NEOLEDRAFT_1184872 [Neolentinus lepideus HHB14362 ss-1]|uniref:Uncharacterized protein n=1 Tax=Neolentinus lepideus HHB14362 ss-1 TaxID=1314782 RepID=A0A165L6W7_9AGAM|nr:hypothetical protein NEOLEDRAFT_1184872 [Neolentinus lepideus HHB14362 ss-1]
MSNGHYQLPYTLSSDARASVRAINRYGIHVDAKHSLLTGRGGLHRNHFALTQEAQEGDPGRKKGFDEQKQMLGDILDAATALDRADGGFTVMFRIPGTLPKLGGYAIKDLCIDTYLSPREVNEHITLNGSNDPSCGPAISQMAGIFAKQAFIHLHRVEARHSHAGVPADRPRWLLTPENVT